MRSWRSASPSPAARRGLPCRITIVDDRGALAPLVVAPDSRLAARPGVVYTPDGRALIGLPPGRYTVSATRGFEYGRRHPSSRPWPRAELRRLDLAIRREVPTEGLVACDTHVHTLTHSGHGDATLDERAVTLAGEGIELPIATDHDHLTTDLAAAADRMGVSAYFTPVVGDEVTTKTGHFNAFPFPAGTKPPDPEHRRLARPAPRDPLRAGGAGRRPEPPARPARRLPAVRPRAIQPGHRRASTRAARRRCPGGDQLRGDAVRPDAAGARLDGPEESRRADHGRRRERQPRRRPLHRRPGPHLHRLPRRRPGAARRRRGVPGLEGRPGAGQPGAAGPDERRRSLRRGRPGHEARRARSACRSTFTAPPGPPPTGWSCSPTGSRSGRPGSTRRRAP